MQNYRPIGYDAAGARPLAINLPFVRRVYTLLTVGIGFAIAGAMTALYAGSPAAVAFGQGYGREVLAVPPVVAFELQHPWMFLLAFFGVAWGAQSMLRAGRMSPAILFGYTFGLGLFVAPSVFLAMMAAAAGHTADASPVRDAFLLSGASFLGLTSYAFITKKDFSYLGATLSTGLWVVIGAGLLAIFLGSNALSLAVASVCVLLFAGYILYDTSRILRADDRTSDAVGEALVMFLNIVNLFLALLRILARARD
jgi:FtsH-binding integral membrane protein